VIIGKTKAGGDFEIRTEAARERVIPLRQWAVPAWDRGTWWGGTLVRHLAPRVTLFTGSVLILLTLFLPVAGELFGSNRTGLEWARGEGIWPGALSLVGILLSKGDSPYPFPFSVPYTLPLGFAVFTLALLLASCLRPELLRKQRLSTWLLAISGTLSLFLIADFFFYSCCEVLIDLTLPLVRSDAIISTGTASLTILVLGGCLRSSFVRKQRWLLLLFAAAGISSLTALGSFSLRLLHSQWALEEQTERALLLAPSVLYWLVPALLWCCFGLSRRGEMRAQWLGLRPRVIAMFAPVAAIDCLFLLRLVVPSEGDFIWGFPVFFAGIHLLSLGYMRLAREANPLLSNGHVSGELEK